MDETRIDLAELDPARDPSRWDEMVDALAARAVARRRRRLTVSHQLAAWSRPVLAMVAVVSLLFGVHAFLAPPGSSPTSEQPDESPYVLLRWAADDERPATSQILQVYGVHHATH